MTLRTLLEKCKDVLTDHGKRHLDRLLLALGVRARAAGLLVGFLCFGLLVGYFTTYVPPKSFPLRVLVTIPEGSSLSEVATVLKDAGAIKNESIFRLYVLAFEDPEQLKAGDYYFDRKLSVAEVAKRIGGGEYGLELVKVTVPEGATTYEIALQFEEVFSRFDEEMFLELAKNKEGYLFPDTYFFLPNATAHQVLDAMERTFYDRIRTLEPLIAASGLSIHEVVTMASLLEKEASDFDQKREISGVLWHRIAIDMPLQVDAVFGYIHATSTFSPKFSHLEIDSPYNTYKNKGLPPGPIGSPGLASLEAAVTPATTTALFYLHGRDGSLHLAQTFNEHVANRRRYLR